MPVYYEDEFGFNLCFTVTDRATGSAFSLVGYTIVLYMWLPSATVPKINGGVCVITNAPGTDGKCHYPVTLTDFDTKGSYNWELVLTSAGVERHARGNGNITIKEEHP